MANKSKSNPKLESHLAVPKRKRPFIWKVRVAAVVFSALVAGVLTVKDHLTATKGSVANQTNSAQSSPAPPPMGTMNINQAVMVTVELDFGPSVPSIADALREVERRFQ